MNSKKKKIVYMDYAATTPPEDIVMNNVANFASMFYNPSSVNSFSIYNKNVIENVRKTIAKTINADPSEIIFTSGGSESNSLAVDGFVSANNDYDVVCSPICHSSILRNMNVERHLNCDKDGFIFLNEINIDKNTLYCIDYVNNEIGCIQNIKDLSKLIHKNDKNILFVDAVQAFCKIDIDVKELGIDMLSASAHKIGGLQGVGFLYVKNGININPIIHGTQENGVRGGTYSSMLIKSFGLAVEKSLEKKENIWTIKNKRDFFIEELSKIDGVKLNGSIFNRIYNNINIRINGISINNQQIVSLLEMDGFIISAGSACHEGNNKPSHVLKAIGLSDEEANSSIRITIGFDNSVQDILDFVEKLKLIIEMNKK